MASEAKPMPKKHVNLIVDSRVRMLERELDADLQSELKKLCEHKNPAYFKSKSMGFHPGKERPTVQTWDLEVQDVDEEGEPAEWFSVPRGVVNDVRELLREHGYTWSIADHRSDPGKLPREHAHLTHNVKLRDYQREMVDMMLKRENALVLGETGCGKTTAVLAFIVETQRASLVVVWTTGLMKQWITRITKELGIKARDIGYIKGGKLKLRPITVAMQQTLANCNEGTWREINDYFGVIACDEVQKFAAKTFLGVIDRSTARYRIGVSQSEKRKDGKHFLIHEQFGDVVLDIDRKRLVEAGIVFDVEVRLIPTDFEAPWYLQQQHAAKLERDGEDGMTIARSLRDTFGLSEEEALEVERVADFNKLLEAMVNDEDRNALITGACSVETRDEHEGLVFSHRVQHCADLDSELTSLGISSGMMVGGKDYERTFDETASGIITGSKKVGIGTYQALGTALDFPSVSFGVASTPIHTNKPFFNQVRGRICRTDEGKTAARLYVLWDRKVFGDEVLHAMCRWNKNVKVHSIFKGGKLEWLDGHELRKELRRAKTKNTKRGGKAVKL